jgi:nucleoside phosphorylase
LVTATPTETKALHSNMVALPNENGLLKISKDNATYYIGTLGHFLVAHVESGMGATGTMGSIITVINALEAIKPKFVLMIGIAFGINPEKQNIGDVLVSNMITPYEIQRVGADGIVWRGGKPEASTTLKNVFKNLRDWEYILPNEEKATFEQCEILSGEKLVDNLDYRHDLEKQFPAAKGGEMEGWGIYSACADKKIEWILVKSICDFADGDKKEHKEEKQALAIDTALSLCFKAFTERYVFENLGVYIYENETTPSTIVVKNTSSNKYEALLNADDIPALFEYLDGINTPDSYSYIRFKKEYYAGLEGIKLLDWKDRLTVFLAPLKNKNNI